MGFQGVEDDFKIFGLRNWLDVIYYLVFWLELSLFKDEGKKTP